MADTDTKFNFTQGRQQGGGNGLYLGAHGNSQGGTAGTYLQQSLGIDARILAVIQQEAKKAAEEVYATRGTMFNVADVPTHTHSGIDSVGLPSLQTIPSSGSGVLSKTQLVGVSGGTPQKLYYTNSTLTPSQTNLLTCPIPIIYGFGSTSTLTLNIGRITSSSLNSGGTGYGAGNVLSLTQINGSGATVTVSTVNGGGTILTYTLTAGGNGYTVANGVSATGGAGTGALFNINTINASLASGATSSTITSAWGGSTELMASKFGDNEVRWVQLTSGSASISWGGALAGNILSPTLTLIAASRFHGGDAPLGTAVIFENTDDGIHQLWVRTDLGGESVPNLIDKWTGFDYTQLSA